MFNLLKQNIIIVGQKNKKKIYRSKEKISFKYREFKNLMAQIINKAASRVPFPLATRGILFVMLAPRSLKTAYLFMFFLPTCALTC